ncbi:hypothetical protein BV394_03000 [Brevirhabdus pacifica]|uniref:Calcineurin-like phosphoesterase domain-containing protein n=1 Tax=Brevirhabdus pacifica TaxID=1267768 RepID=A0A1U7DFQ1_9RHOB|nr:metallophosphoesterase [Brevirhabdus pacifica]APX88824.1 hypothetical protein BV394_03000 [Brevirhabdus pacifica]OWU80067.1 hypothetical protein ATO5_03685 [Loktanella sp. 22II-4b]
MEAPLPPFRFIHSSDLHLGKRFGTLPEAIRGQASEARHNALHALARAARDHEAGHILVAGDVFDTETPTEQVWRQALTAMAGAEGIDWWLLPGNHDSLAAESLWQRVAAQAPANVHVLTEAAPLEIAPGVMLLPAPLSRKFPGRDLTDYMPAAATPAGALRIGLAHGAIQGFDEDGVRAEEIIPPDRAQSAGLDYLALGDWHGQMRIGARTWFSGAPERDGFRHAGRGACLAVTLDGPGAEPVVDGVPTGTLHWAEAPLPLLPGQDAAQALQALLPPAAERRQTLLRIRATGRASLPEQAALHRAAEDAAPEFGFFELLAAGLATEYDEADLSAVIQGGALQAAAEELGRPLADETAPEEDRRLAGAALNRLYAYLQEDAS